MRLTPEQAAAVKLPPIPECLTPEMVKINTLRVAIRSLLAEARPHVRSDLIVAAEHALEISGGV